MEENKSSENKQEQKEIPNNEAAEQYNVSHAPTPHVVHVKKSPLKMILIALLVFALFCTSAYLGYAYYQEKQNTKDLQTQLNSPHTDKAEELSGTSDVGQAENMNSEVSYKAEVGKFTLTLPSEYVIIRNIDGANEGGPITDLTVARNTELHGVIANSYSPNKVYSLIKLDGNNLDALINTRNSEFSNTDIKELAKITVDGAEAKVYRLSGPSDINRVYFQNDTNVYEFESLAPESNDSLSEDLNAIIAGFKFN